MKKVLFSEASYDDLLALYNVVDIIVPGNLPHWLAWAEGKEEFQLSHSLAGAIRNIICAPYKAPLTQRKSTGLLIRGSRFRNSQGVRLRVCGISAQ